MGRVVDCKAIYTLIASVIVLARGVDHVFWFDDDHL